jgi:hypothetical protein
VLIFEPKPYPSIINDDMIGKSYSVYHYYTGAYIGCAHITPLQIDITLPNNNVSYYKHSGMTADPRSFVKNPRPRLLKLLFSLVKLTKEVPCRITFTPPTKSTKEST